MKSDSQAIEHWKIYAKEFAPDGSLRDILVLGTSERDWHKAMSFIAAQTYEFRFRGKWTGETFPDSIGRLFATAPNDEYALLSINVSDLVVNCPFFTEAEIEFDVDPREVTDASKLAGLFAFMHGLANSVSKEVLMTPEGLPEDVIFRCRPNEDLIDYQPFFNGATTSVLFSNE